MMHLSAFCQMFNEQNQKCWYFVDRTTGWPKKFGTVFSVRLKLLYQILTDFQNYFTVSIRRKFVIRLLLKIPPHLKCVATLPCEMSVSKATIENKTTSVTTHFKKLTTGNNVFIVSVIV